MNLDYKECKSNCSRCRDNAAAAVGTGTVGDGHVIFLWNIRNIFISSKKFGVDENNALHSFAMQMETII